MKSIITVSNINNNETVTLLQPRPRGTRRRFRKILNVLLGIILSVGVTVMIFHFAKKARQGDENSLLSESDGLGMANDMADYYVDPCDDFYEYACGGYINRHTDASKPYTYANRFSNMTKKNIQIVKEAIEVIQDMGSDNGALVKATEYYTSCLDNDATLSLSPYWQALQDIGGAPLADSLWMTQSKSSWNIVKALQKLHLNYGTYPLFKVTINPNLKNTSENIFMLELPDLGLTTKVVKKKMFDAMYGIESKDLKEKLRNLEMLSNSYQGSVQDTFVTAAVIQSGQDDLLVEKYVADAIDLERTLIRYARYSIYVWGAGDIHSTYQTMTVKELTTLMKDRFDWKEFLGGLVKGISKTTVSSDTKVGLIVPKEYLSYIGHFLVYFSESNFANYFAWTLLKKMSPVLPVIYFDAYHNIEEGNSVEDIRERWRACLIDTEVNMPLTTGLMFAEMTSTDTKRNLAERMLKEIHMAFEVGLDKVGWLDDTTRAAAKLKAKNMIHVVADLDHEDEKRAIEQRYAEITPPSNIADFLISCQRNLVKENLRLFDSPGQRKEWISSSSFDLLEANAFYDRTKNLMVILAGIMQEPFIYENAPNYLNFGKLGVIIGHEMLHGFDNLGWYFDKDGNIAPWWTEHASSGFDSHSRCLSNQYSKFPYAYGRNISYVKGKKTLAENIADNGGVKYAYQAYKHWTTANKISEKKPSNLNYLNGDQLFFLSYAQLWCQAISNNVKQYLLKYDEHSPAMYRVIGSLMNLKEFGKAFQCPVGSRMNPSKRCEFW